MFRSRYAALLLVLFFVSSLPGFGTSIRKYTLEEQAGQAEGIYLGRVLEQKSYWNEEGTLILTDYTIAVRTTIAGAARSRLVITEVGGEVGDIGLMIPGAASYSVGEEAVIFTHREAGRLMTLHFEQGRYKVDTIPRGRQEPQRFVTDPLSNLPVDLDSFVDRIRRARVSP